MYIYFLSGYNIIINKKPPSSYCIPCKRVNNYRLKSSRPPQATFIFFEKN